MPRFCGKAVVENAGHAMFDLIITWKIESILEGLDLIDLFSFYRV